MNFEPDSVFPVSHFGVSNPILRYRKDEAEEMKKDASAAGKYIG
jgi:hypothetical protein